jgi:hypothetical protein
VSLACPPEWIAFHELILFELRPCPEALVEAQRTSIFLEECVNSWQTAVPGIFEVFESQAPILLVSF